MVCRAIFDCEYIEMYTVYLSDILSIVELTGFCQQLLISRGSLITVIYLHTHLANSISCAFTVSKHDTHVVNKHSFIYVYSISVLPHASLVSWTANPVSVASSTSSISQSSTEQVSIHNVASKIGIKVKNGGQALVYNWLIKFKALDFDW